MSDFYFPDKTILKDTNRHQPDSSTLSIITTDESNPEMHQVKKGFQFQDHERGGGIAGIAATNLELSWMNFNLNLLQN